MSTKPIIIKGKLKLKGDTSSVSKKRKQVDPSSSYINSSSDRHESAITSSATATSTSAPTSDNDVHLTEAQKKFLKRKKEAEDRAIKSLTSKTYRDRIEEFNNKLSTMTEHNDIPRISAAGNG